MVTTPRRRLWDPTSRWDSTDVTPGGSSGKRPLARQPPSLATNLQTFRAYTAGTIETESPQSEVSPQVIPPIPPWPTPFPHLGGLRRKSTRRDSNDSFGFAHEEDVPTTLQPPIIMPIPNPPLPQTPGHPPPPPTPLRQPLTPGDGVGGFAVPSSQHELGRDDSHFNTADYTYRFDTMPSPRSESPPHYESEDVTGGIHAKVWPTYNKISQEFDDKRLEKCISDLDVLLIFVSLVVGGNREFQLD